MILDDIVAAKIRQLDKLKLEIPRDELEKQITNTSSRDFAKALIKSNDISIIAEVKKASPSKGVIKENFNPIAIAKLYGQAKVDAISVLTETHFFLGRNEYLTQVKQVTTVPVLRKDFIIDEYQIIEAKVLGADAILLIVSILDECKLKKYIEYAGQFNMKALVEVHDQDELKTALNCGAQIIGINNRNLKTFETSIKHTEEIIKFIPKDKIVISESGIHTAGDMEYLIGLGVNGVLIGESLMRSHSIDKKIAELRGIYENKNMRS